MFQQKLFFVGILNVNDKKAGSISQRHGSADLDPGIWIRIRIHSKMSWIRNTATRPSGIVILWFHAVLGIRMIGSKTEYTGSACFWASRIRFFPFSHKGVERTEIMLAK
jgi:hypothetical protein